MATHEKEVVFAGLLLVGGFVVMIMGLGLAMSIAEYFYPIDFKMEDLNKLQKAMDERATAGYVMMPFTALPGLYIMYRGKSKWARAKTGNYDNAT